MSTVMEKKKRFSKPEDFYDLDQMSVQLNPHVNGGKTRSHIGSRDVITLQ